MVVGGSQQETLDPGFVLFVTRQQGVPVILRELVLPGGFDLFIRVKGNIKKAYEKVPGLESVLPREYGGHNRSIKDILKEQNADFKEYFLKNEILWRGMAVNERKRPESSKRLIGEYKEADDRSMGTTGTFIPLPVND
ncbi:unnamed protein product [Schistosoma curassoni]|uniref:DUF655 domain-containing protein n=1 Tax=Schistosoma curassoni TaxID=6186 RepID=A0A183KME0_9TREM|nr:unnamed protein product [Schistosoma curassoni]